MLRISLKEFSITKLYTFKNIITSQNFDKIDSKFFNKYLLIPLAWPFTWLFLMLKITPNQATFFRFLLFIAGIVFILYSYNYLGYIFLYLNLIFDNVDGQISRVKNQASYLGKFFDGLLDTVSSATFPTIISVAVFYDTNNPSIIIVGIISTVLNILYLYLLMRYSFFLKIIKKNDSESSNFLIKYIEGRMLIDWYDVKYFSFLIFLAFSAEFYFILYCLIINFLIFLLLFIIKIYKAVGLFNIHRVSKSKQ